MWPKAHPDAPPNAILQLLLSPAKQQRFRGDKVMRVFRTLARVIAVIVALIAGSNSSQAQVYYIINGQPASSSVTLFLAQQGFPPGCYLYQNGSLFPCQSPPGYSNNGRNQGAPWSRSDNSGFNYGTDGKGCYYAGDWSNC
jgi:hypothetical protein